MGEFNVPVQLCPTCGGTLQSAFLRDSLGNVDLRPPKPGDGVVCIGCGSMLQFNEALRVELVDLSRVDPATRERIRDMQESVRLFRTSLRKISSSAVAVN